jgi:hypothetical protein
MYAAHAVTTNTRYGQTVLATAASGNYNTTIGQSAGNGATTMNRTTLVGFYAGRLVTSSSDCTMVGFGAGHNNTVGLQSTHVGSYAGYNNSGSKAVTLGYYAGRYTAEDNVLFIDAVDRTDTAGDKAKALIFGKFNDTASSQTLALNAAVTATYGLATTGLKTGYTAKTTTYIATDQDYLIHCTGTFTVTLPTATAGRQFVVKNSGTGVITIDGNASEPIEAALTQVVNAGQSFTLCGTGTATGWVII